MGMWEGVWWGVWGGVGWGGGEGGGGGGGEGWYPTGKSGHKSQITKAEYLDLLEALKK